MRTFHVQGETLVQDTTPANGNPYRHSCPLADLAELAHTIDEAGEDGIGLAEVQAATGIAWTRLSVAAAFLFERGSIRRVFRRRYAAVTNDTYIDAMVEYHALREGSPGSTPPETPA